MPLLSTNELIAGRQDGVMQINPSHNNTQTYQVHTNHLDILQFKLYQQYLSAL